MESCKNNIHAASDGAQDKKVRVRVLGRGTRSKSKLQSPPHADRQGKPINALDKRLGRHMGATHRKCTRAGPNCRDLAIGNWNVLSLTGKEQELVGEAQQYRLHTVGISSTKRSLVSPNIAECDWVPLGERVCFSKLRLQERFLCILQVYAPITGQSLFGASKDCIGKINFISVPCPALILMHMWASTAKPGKVLLGNMVTLTLTRTEGVYCSSVSSMDCA